jgi:hypothetical protein
MREHILGIALVLSLAGCGTGAASSGDGGNGGGVAGAGGSRLTWLDDGVAQTANLAIASRMLGSKSDFLEIIGSEASGTGITLTVSGPPTLGGTYDCGGDAGAYVAITYTGTTHAQSCTISVTSAGMKAGANAAGKFSAVLVTTGGAIKALTEGSFDVPVTITGS